MMPRTIVTEDHEIFREQVRRFIEQEITPYHDQWNKDEVVPLAGTRGYNIRWLKERGKLVISNGFVASA